MEGQLQADLGAQSGALQLTLSVMANDAERQGAVGRPATEASCWTSLPIIRTIPAMAETAR
ncbi:hypothetical protein [Modestobacter altitudinis]|uniref:hypothetical protein n=1 Tax=Modestobacter altitudinis TaxID=2213158 RepID=UPI00110CA1EB|nr:hypothetical protein [Modestobacter altitudinis]